MRGIGVMRLTSSGGTSKTAEKMNNSFRGTKVNTCKKQYITVNLGVLKSKNVFKLFEKYLNDHSVGNYIGSQVLIF